MSAKTILVVDDEPFILRALTFVLNREGYRTISASNGEEALARIREERPALVFLDVMMPRKDGFEVCREIKDDPVTAGVHIILLTAKGQDADRERGLAAGANEYMTKPFSPSEVVSRVREVVGWPEAGVVRG
jgi:two-component system, OmpR family, alkaline phosphatase synthesis response regulator PhoP